ncbi:acyl-CoA dehydrogenase family protein [bacterium]|nr:acyl-CoA dehydrogenase family protein [bacterium]
MFSLVNNPELEQFRAEVSRQLDGIEIPQVEDDSALESFVEIGKAWQQRLAALGLVGVHWPQEFGGGGKTLVEEAIVQEELAKRGAPQLLGLFGLTMVGPVLIECGTPGQRERYLSKILDASEIWCQGFSEPNAGSDLAAMSTTATPTSGGYTLSGQKIWTSFAHIADHCFLVARTGPEGERYKNLTYFLVPMNAPGITVRPLRQITGDSEFNEVFFDDVYVSEENRVGEEGDGWGIAIRTLMYERVILTFARQIQSEGVLRSLLSSSDEMTGPQRSELTNLIIDACATRALAYRHLLAYAKGSPPGPEGSLNKLGWSEFFQRLAHFARRCEGQDAIFETSDVQRYLYSRGRTIAAGTSEVQRGIIAERVLNLPRVSRTQRS